MSGEGMTKERLITMKRAVIANRGVFDSETAVNEVFALAHRGLEAEEQATVILVLQVQVSDLRRACELAREVVQRANEVAVVGGADANRLFDACSRIEPALAAVGMPVEEK